LLPGESLWIDLVAGVPAPACRAENLGGATPSDGCRQFLAGSEKARLQWRLEAAFTAFEEGF
jgi:hypothetical protein